MIKKVSQFITFSLCFLSLLSFPPPTHAQPSIAGDCYFPVPDGNYQLTNNFGQVQTRVDGQQICQTGERLTIATDQPIVAATAGTVTTIFHSFERCTAGDTSAIGIQSGDYYYVYGLLDQGSLQVSVGDSVTAGQLLATAGACGSFYFEISQGTTRASWEVPADSTLTSSCLTEIPATQPPTAINPASTLATLASDTCSSPSTELLPSFEALQPYSPNAYINSNNYARSVYGPDQLTAHLLYDGNQAYCAAPTTTIDGFTVFEYNQMEVKLNSATIPLLRNQAYSPNRLNSAENYYGYISNFTANTEENLLVESSWLGKSLNTQTSCQLKVENLLYINAETQKCVQEANVLCQGDAACVETAQEYCDNLHFTIADAPEENTSKDLLIPDLLAKNVTLLPQSDSDQITPGVYCQNLLASSNSNDILIENLISRLPLFIYNQYQTAYIVEATRICPAPPPNSCEVRTCVWSDYDDVLRVYPFKIPDLGTNKNYCDINDPGYPNSCLVHEQILDYNSTQNYLDPLTRNAQYLQSPATQIRDRNQSIATRTQIIDTQLDPSVEPLIDCENCTGSDIDYHLKQSLVSLINKSATYYSANPTQPTANGQPLDCSLPTEPGETTTGITTSAAHNPVATVFQENSIPESVSFEESCCVYYEDGVCQEWEYAEAKIRYWIVGPQGEQYKESEEAILGTFYNRTPDEELAALENPTPTASQAPTDANRALTLESTADQATTDQTTTEQTSTQPSSSPNTTAETPTSTGNNYTYNYFTSKDPRYNEYLSLQNVSGGAQDFNILGAAPITSIFQVQQSLYPRNHVLWQTLSDYPDIATYFLNNSGALAASSGTTGGVTNSTYPANPQSEAEILQAICAKFGDAYGAEVASQAVAIARAESSLDPTDCNGTAYGLMQVHLWYDCYDTLGVSRVDNGDWSCEAARTDCAPGFTVIGNLDLALAKFAENHWCPWSTYTTGNYGTPCTTSSSQSWLTQGRGNYPNNQAICIQQGGSIVYNPAGDCGQDGSCPGSNNPKTLEQIINDANTTSGN